MTTPTRKSARHTTVPRWFVVLAAAYGTVLTFLAASFILGVNNSGSRSHASSALMTGFTQWWPSASTAAAVVAVLCVSVGIAASRKRRVRARQRV